MISIKLVCVGNLKEKFWKDACDEYSKRLSKFCKLNIVEVAEQNKTSSISQTLEKEGEGILRELSPSSTLLALDGQQLTSEEFARFLEKEALTSSELVFVIGGSYGVSERVKKAAKHKISFGKPTFPHNLARVMLLEQVYRAFMINAGASYHK